ncbi:MAG: EamA family transporter [Planctomycetia bacterium]|nr:EamA family transporter [Planctomycetia bacterium]
MILSQSQTPAPSQPIKAAFYMLGTILSFTLLLVGGREMGGQLDTFEIMMYRSFIGIVIVLGVARISGTLTQIKTNRLRLHLGRNLLHFMGQNLWFYAVVFIPLSQLVAFEFTTPLWVLALAPFFLKEKLTLSQIGAAVIGFIGILVVARPGAAEFSWPLMAAIFCAVGFAGAILTTKRLTSDQSVTCILFWLVVIQAVLGVVAAGADRGVAGAVVRPSEMLGGVFCRGRTGAVTDGRFAATLTETTQNRYLRRDSGSISARWPHLLIVGVLRHRHSRCRHRTLPITA